MPAFGVGTSASRDARGAGREAARGALAAAGAGGASGVLVFATAGHDQGELLRGVTEITGAAPLSGCSTSGTITSAGLDERTHAVAVLVFASEKLSFDTFRVQGLSGRARAGGLELAARVRERAASAGGKLLLLFADGHTANVADLILAAEESLPRPLVVAGGTAGALLRLQRDWQYHDGIASSDSVSAALIGGELVADVAVTHGCDPIGVEQTVTRADNGWIYEIDGKPAWTVFQTYLDAPGLEALSMSHVCYLCLAESLPEPDAAYGEFVVRCPLQLDRATGALFFPGNLRRGAKVRMALRNPELMIERACASARALVARHDARPPALVLHFDCCCRGRLLFGRHTNERTLAPLREALGNDVPWFGFSTYGEIAPLRPGGRTLFHNYSAVLCALYGDVP